MQDHTVEAVFFLMIIIVTELMEDEERDDQAAGYAHSKSQDIDNNIGFLAAQCTKAVPE
jgi:hypothetical protein